MSTREEVYKAIDGEREYQDSMWNENTTSSKGIHTCSEWILYMEEYLKDARTLAATTPEGNVEVVDFIRKVTTMGVACMEQNGAPHRRPREVESW